MAVAQASLENLKKGKKFTSRNRAGGRKEGTGKIGDGEEMEKGENRVP